MKRPSLIHMTMLLGASAFAQSGQQPISLAIVLDTSGSMTPKMPLVRGLINELAKAAGERDEFAVIQAADRPVLLGGGFGGAASAGAHVSTIHAKGRTALLDGMYLGSQLLKTSRNARRVLLVISDGVDNHSRYGSGEVTEALREARASVYTFQAGSLGADEASGAAGQALLRRLAVDFGGLYLTTGITSDLSEAARHLAVSMRE